MVVEQDVEDGRVRCEEKQDRDCHGRARVEITEHGREEDGFVTGGNSTA